MKFESVLGYSDNTLVLKYQELYFKKLKIFLSRSNISSTLQEEFEKLELGKQKEFLLHPDISSLLQDIDIHKSAVSQEKLLKEFHNLSEQEIGEWSQSRGANIRKTGIRLTLDDNNPQNSIVNHPDHDGGGMLGWGEKTPDEWNDVFSRAFSLLQDINQDFFDELNTIITKIVPMKTSRDVHNSCSYKECIGTLYLGYTINATQPELNILEALIHESSHNKLNLIMQSERLHINDFQEKYYSPYRPDARHIQGVLLGTHAIIPSVYIMLQAIESGYIQDPIWHEKILLYHIKNKLGYRVLQKHAKFTQIGNKIFQDMGEVIKICDGMIHANLLMKSLNLREIQQRAKNHFLEVQQNYPNLQY